MTLKTARIPHGQLRAKMTDLLWKAGRKEMFYLTTHSTHFYLRLSGVRHMVKDHSDGERGNPGYSIRLASRILLYAPSHIQDSTYHGLCYTSRGAELIVSLSPFHENKNIFLLVNEVMWQ